MKIKPSIKVSVLATMLLLGALISAMYSVFMFRYFVKGLNIATHVTMKQVADIKEVPAEQPVIGNFYISDTWEEVPEFIRKNYETAPKIEDRVVVASIKELFEPPEVVFFVMKDTNRYGDTRFVSRAIYNDAEIVKEMKDTHFRSVIIVIIIFIASITIFYLFTLVIFKRISRPVEKLGHWAENLNEKV